MATILAYTSPALGHLLPISALLSEMSRRGHNVHVRTLSSGVDTARRLGFEADAIDPRIEAIVHDDWKAPNIRVALKMTIDVFCRRAVHEVGDFRDAVSRVRPDAVIVDVNCWGALSVADAGAVPWLCFSPYTPLLESPGVPPFGPGLSPLPGLLGRLRDAALRPVVTGKLEKSMLAPLNKIRRDVGAPAVASADEFMRRAPLMLVASGKPFEYPQTDWGDAVQMIGPCIGEPAADATPDWLAAINRPIVLVTTSSETQADAKLVQTAMTAFADEPVHVVATLPAGLPTDVTAGPNATVCEFVPHGAVLDRAVCAVTHGGMGATQRALAHRVPVCVVPFGRDQFEVARRVEVARCGTRLPANKLTPARLLAKVREAMTMTDGARRVAQGFEATGGVARGADLIAKRLPLRLGLLVVALALTSCQFSFSAGGPDYAKLEKAITDELNASYAPISQQVSSVECPRDTKPKTGETFICNADVDGNNVRVEATLTDDSGNVDFSTLDVVYDLAAAARGLSREISQERGFAVSVTCGEGLKVVAIGESFECTAADRKGVSRTVAVTAGGPGEGDHWEIVNE